MIIVFDSFLNHKGLARTKTSERVRRSRKNQSPEFTIDESIYCSERSIGKEKFLARDQYKDDLIQILGRYYKKTGIKVEQAFFRDSLNK